MGLRNREPEPLRNGRQSSGGAYWNHGISTHGCAGVSTRLPIVADTGIPRVGIFALPRAYRKRHSWSVVHLLRDLIGDDLAADIARARYRTDAVASSPVCSFGMN